MSNFEHLKKKAIAQGIKPGAVIACASCPGDIATVPPISEWYQFADGHIGFLWEGVTMNRIYINTNHAWAKIITPAPEDQSSGLVERMACKPDKFMCKVIVQKANELNLKSNVIDSWEGELRWEEGMLWETMEASTWKKRNNYDLTIISPGEFYDRLCNTKAPEPPIYIGDHKVTFNSDSIKVGCTVVPNDIVLQIADKIKNKTPN